MTAATTLTRAALLSLSVLAGVLAAATSGAEANPIWKLPIKMPFPKPFPQPFPHPWPHPYPGPHFGYGPAIFGGLALGALAASAAVEEDCPVVRRVMVDSDGNEYIRRIRVCD